ncbi:hypothetical protein CK203_108426 [Vitis vinifera]|uniref:Uncharacterized protein n=1 Tax=Vitis vinifera TaxID=29760 RepID=A0A438CQC7_VITVI|nr:hypothetical protein CK203_108426 [Vitis vinifera]
MRSLNDRCTNNLSTQRSTLNEIIPPDRKAPRAGNPNLLLPLPQNHLPLLLFIVKFATKMATWLNGVGCSLISRKRNLPTLLRLSQLAQFQTPMTPNSIWILV